MFRITRLTDYGVLLMTELASSGESVHNAGVLAERAHLPAPTVSKILQVLQREGLLLAVRGAGGGYQLTRAATDISIRDIIVALEGPIALTECNLEHSHCDQEQHCATRSNWQVINLAVRHALDGITLADMIEPGFQPVMHMEKRHADTRMPVTQGR